MQQNTRKTNNPIKKWGKDLNMPRKAYRWLINTQKVIQHHSLLEKHKSKLQCGITSHRSQWPSSKNPQTSAEESVEKRDTSCTVGGNVN